VAHRNNQLATTSTRCIDPYIFGELLPSPLAGFPWPSRCELRCIQYSNCFGVRLSMNISLPPRQQSDCLGRKAW